MPIIQNHLANETSPYLLQHVTNPVDWYPWHEEALTKAKQENKPILLSIGYAACHWCHVMAHESFEDEETAVLMNRWFINIKVDREERPDLDKIYQTAHHLLSQHNGGWPLTLFLAPHDLTPFYTGTYFPKEARYGLPSFKQILQGIAELYQSQQYVISEQNQQLRRVLANISTPQSNLSALTSKFLNSAREELAAQFDESYGGFGTAPKFPQPSYLKFLLTYWCAEDKQDDQALAMTELTLTQMAQGGIYDQIGGGFCRYSIDDHWEIPHFEKMLYDNAQLLTLYTAAFASTHKALYAQVVRETAAWIRHDMQAPDGGYYAARDADSEGEEGKYYRWSREELQRILAPAEYSAVSLYYGLNLPPNFENHWHCCIKQSLTAVAFQLGLTESKAQHYLQTAKQKMAEARTDRIPPLRDEKILTSWNGLMIKAMANAALTFQESNYLTSAQKAVDFIHNHLWQDGRLLATYKDSRAKYKAYLDDYAFLLEGLLSILQAQWRSQDLTFAIELAEVLLAYYQDEAQGGFFFTAHDHEALIQRPKSFFDEAVPAGNGVAAYVLGRLGHLLGERRYLTTAEQTIKAAGHYLEQAPQGCASILVALQDYLLPPGIIILRGSVDAMHKWHQYALQGYHPQRLCFAIPDNATQLPAKLQQMPNIAEVTAYICQGQHCFAPITEFSEFKTQLAS